MIEIIIKEYLDNNFHVPIFSEKPIDKPKRFIVIDKTGSGKNEHLPSATIAFQSYAESKYEASLLNEQLKTVIENMINLNEIRFVELNSDYNFTDTTTKEYKIGRAHV